MDAKPGWKSSSQKWGGVHERGRTRGLNSQSLAYLELLIGLLNKLGEGLDESEIQGLIYVLGDIRTQVQEIRALLFDKEEKP